MHSGNGSHEEMDGRAIAYFDQALSDLGLAQDRQLAQVLHDYFAWATATTMSRYHESADDVPDGLRIPRWSWDGLIKKSDNDGGVERLCCAAVGAPEPTRLLATR
jgi:hemoglobin